MTSTLTPFAFAPCSHFRMRAFALFVLVGLGVAPLTSAYAQTYTLPGGPLPSDCSASGSTVTCSDDVDIDGNQSVAVSGFVTWIIEGDLTVEDDASINQGGSSGNLNIQVDGAVELEGRGLINANVSSDDEVNIGEDAAIIGNVAASDDVTLEGRGEITGDAEVGGDMEISDDAGVGGNASADGDLLLDGRGSVGGSASADGVIALEDDSSITGGVAGAASVSLQDQGEIIGQVNSSGNVTLEDNSRIDGDVISDATVSLASNTEITGCVAAPTINNSGTIGCTENVVLLASDTEVDVGDSVTLAVAAQGCDADDDWVDEWIDPDGFGVSQTGPQEFGTSPCERAPTRTITAPNAPGESFDITFVSRFCLNPGCPPAQQDEFGRDTVTITVNAQSQLNFAQQPTDAEVDAALNPPVTVRVEDGDGNLVETYDDDITLQIEDNPGSGTLTGTTTVAAEGGIATFDNVSVDTAGDAYTLRATADAAIDDVSTTFDILADAVVITGQVLELGSGRDGVDILVDGGSDVATVNGGLYSATVRPNADVTLTPQHDDLIFCPPSRTVAVNDADRPGIGFQAFPDEPAPTGAGSGGDVILGDDGDAVHVFCSTGADEFEPPEGVSEVEVLLAGGGGGGGAPLHFSSAGGGGGGAGGLVYRDSYAVSGTTGVSVGSGGARGDTPGQASAGETGADSAFGGLEAIGGGGGSGDNEAGSDGGSGGGSRGSPGSSALQPSSPSGGFGNRGGVHDTGRDPTIHRAATGGGGASEAGEDLDGIRGEDGGFGGDGLDFAILGVDLFFAGGGGGGVADNGNQQAGDPGDGGEGGGGRGGRTGVPAIPGFPGTGGGGGGGNNSVPGADGGSGIVVVRYTVPEPVLTCRGRDFESELGPEWDTESVSGSFGEPRAIDGALRLTDDSGNVSTRATILNELPWDGNRVEVTFRHFAYGGSGADGIAVVFSDADVAPSPGGFGGSLGYAQRDDVDGFAGGWVGIGFDEFGNYSNPSEGREGGPGSRSNAIVIRGDGEGRDGYEYLAGTESLSPQLWDSDADTRDDMTGDVYRITVDTTEPETWLVRIERDTSGTGDDFETVLETDVFGQQATDPPEEVFLSFTGSTGGSTNIHEMDFLEICANRGIEDDQEVDRYQVSHAGQGLTCVAEPVTITALDADGDPVAPADGTVLDLFAATDSGGQEGDWARLINGGGSFTSGAIGSGTGSYTFPGDESQAIIAYQYAQLQNDPENVVLSVDDGEASGSSDGPLSVSLAGFRFVNRDDATTIIPDQISGKPSDMLYNASDLGLQAIRASDADPTVCERQFKQGKTATIELGAECSDPAQCAGEEMEVGGTPIATGDDNGDPDSASAYSAVDLTFDANSVAPLVLRYTDAGRTRLHARYEIPLAEDPDDPEAGQASGGFMLGASNPFVWRPFGFAVDVDSPDDGVSPTGNIFRVAGEVFPARLRAVIWDGEDFDGDQPDANADLSDNVTTPNFGNESNPVSAAIAPTVAAPAPVDGGIDGTLTNAVYDDFGAQEAGEQEIEDVTWNEVGYVDLEAELDGDYLGTQTITGRAEDVGRFIPDSFTVSTVSLDDRAALSACTGDFTYIGERFDVAFNLAARNVAGGRTRNYTDSYARLTSGQLDMGATDSDQDLTADLNVDSRSLVWDQGRGDAVLELSLARSTPTGPFAELKIGTNPVDGDGVDVEDPDLALDGGGATHAEVGETELRFGRIVLDNDLGTESAPLTVPLRVEYWDGATWRINDLDDCTVLDLADEVVLTADTAATADGTEDVTLASGGETGIEQEDEITVGSAGFAGGEAQFDFSAPGAPGWVEISLSLADRYGFLQDDLQQDFDAGSWSDDPTARATFGRFGGNPNQIYREEVLR